MFKKIIILLSGLCITLYALYGIAKPLYLMLTGTSAKGIVVAYGKKEGGHTKNFKGSSKHFFSWGKKAVIHFLPLNAKDSVTCIASGGLFITHYSINETIPVYYNSNNPHNNSVANFTQVSTMLPVLLFGSLLLLVIAKPIKKKQV